MESKSRLEKLRGKLAVLTERIEGPQERKEKIARALWEYQGMLRARLDPAAPTLPYDKPLMNGPRERIFRAMAVWPAAEIARALDRSADDPALSVTDRLRRLNGVWNWELENLQIALAKPNPISSLNPMGGIIAELDNLFSLTSGRAWLGLPNDERSRLLNLYAEYLQGADVELVRAVFRELPASRAWRTWPQVGEIREALARAAARRTPAAPSAPREPAPERSGGPVALGALVGGDGEAESAVCPGCGSVTEMDAWFLARAKALKIPAMCTGCISKELEQERERQSAQLAEASRVLVAITQDGYVPTGEQMRMIRAAGLERELNERLARAGKLTGRVA